MFIAQHIVISVKSKSFVFYGHTTPGTMFATRRSCAKNALKKEKEDTVFRDRK